MTLPRVEERVRVVAHRWSPGVRALRRRLAHARVPYLWLDAEDDEDATRLLHALGRADTDLPLVLLPDGTELPRADDATLTRALDLPAGPSSDFLDLVVVGGGPAGLSAAVYAAGEGLATTVVEASTPGGQAGHSTSIENYLGFPEGLTGEDLARRAVAQAERHGVEIIARRAVGLRFDGDYRGVALDDGTTLDCHTVLLAPGLTFDWLDVPGFSRLVGAGVWYGAVTADASAFAGHEVYLMGGGDRSASAALALAEHARAVHLLLRDSKAEEALSTWFAERLADTPNATVHAATEVAAAHGDARLERLTLRTTAGDAKGATHDVPATDLFLYSGATPRTEWLRGVVKLDEHGFVLTGRSAYGRRGEPGAVWPETRDPYLLETSCPGVFAAGDVRHGSVKRLASAIGEGAMAVHFIQEYRQER